MVESYDSNVHPFIDQMISFRFLDNVDWCFVLARFSADKKHFKILICAIKFQFFLFFREWRLLLVPKHATKKHVVGVFDGSLHISYSYDLSILKTGIAFQQKIGLLHCFQCLTVTRKKKTFLIRSGFLFRVTIRHWKRDLF